MPAIPKMKIVKYLNFRCSVVKYMSTELSTDRYQPLSTEDFTSFTFYGYLDLG